MKKLIIIVACALAAPLGLQAQTITTTPNSNFVTSGTGRDIALNGTTDSWTLNLATNTGASLDLFSIVGNAAVAGTSDLGYYTDTNGAVGLTGNQLVVGRNANGHTGTFVWKFVLDSGFTTTGGTISANVGFRGTPSTEKANMFIGVNNIFTPSAGPAFSSYNSGDFSKVNISSNSTVFDVYLENGLSLNVPVGVSEFFVVLSDAGSNGRFGLESLSVNVTAIPEPSSFALIAAGIVGISLMRRRRRQA